MFSGFLSGLFGRRVKSLAPPEAASVDPSERAGVLDERAVALRCAHAREEERRRMAVDLHDGPIQQLVNLVLRLDIAEKSLPPGADDARKEIASLRQVTKDVLQDMRRFMFELRPASLDEFALIPVLRQYIHDFGAQYGIAVEMHLVDMESNLGRDPEISIFRIIQEALTNVRKHAKATRADVTLTYTGGRVIAEVADNGTGFDVEAASKRALNERRLGIASMGDRARAVAGSLAIESGSTGTRVKVGIPVTSRSVA